MRFTRICSLVIACFFMTMPAHAQEVNWMTWEEAAKALEKQPKKIFVDIYTNWCGWCKKMDSSTFKEADIVQELNATFYAVKLNAEQKETIHWQGQDFPWVAGGRDGVNKLAYELLDGQMSYPTYVILDEAYARILISPGYKDGPTLMKELKYAGGNHYKKTSWEEFKAKSK